MEPPKYTKGNSKRFIILKLTSNRNGPRILVRSNSLEPEPVRPPGRTGPVRPTEPDRSGLNRTGRVNPVRVGPRPTRTGPIRVGSEPGHPGPTRLGSGRVQDPPDPVRVRLGPGPGPGPGLGPDRSGLSRVRSVSPSPRRGLHSLAYGG
jgi:hypothetical protein